MRIVYIDIDTLRPDHLGCYGYHRTTSPNIDSIADDAVRFNACFVPDAPCLPSRSALHHGRFGVHNGALCHGGTYADPYPEGPGRSFSNTYPYKKFVQVLRAAGMHNCLVSSFAGRHDSWWFYAGFHDIYDCGKGGMEIQSEVTGKALDKLDALNGRDNWYLHFNIWDPHSPYRTPAEYGNPFEKDAPPSWMTQAIIDEHNNTYGQHCAANNLRESHKFSDREPNEIKTLADFKKHIDGYDVGVRFADDAVGKIIAKLKAQGIYDDTAIIISSDHGENQGELNVYGDHQTADLITNRVPMIVKWPGITPRVYEGLHYQFDIAATVVELLGQKVPGKWDAVSFKDAFTGGTEAGRDHLVVSNAAWSAMRAVIFKEHILIKTYRDPVREYPELMLFNRFKDPHETKNLADAKPETVNEGLAILQCWIDEQMECADRKEDPFMKVIAEGGPYHLRGRLDGAIAHYEKIGRKDLADKMRAKYKPGSGQYAADWHKDGFLNRP
ncbi:MAG: sulfatase [Spirochaetes bacterium]|nr:sulfatase [Spirochaetota bacterium]